MIYQHLVKRTIYEAKCSCGKFKDDVVNTPPRERMCSCGKEWCRYEEVSATGPDLLTENNYHQSPGSWGDAGKKK